MALVVKIFIVLSKEDYCGFSFWQICFSCAMWSFLSLWLIISVVANSSFSVQKKGYLMSLNSMVEFCRMYIIEKTIETREVRLQEIIWYLNVYFGVPSPHFTPQNSDLHVLINYIWAFQISDQWVHIHIVNIYSFFAGKMCSHIVWHRKTKTR